MHVGVGGLVGNVKRVFVLMDNDYPLNPHPASTLIESRNADVVIFKVVNIRGAY